MNQSLINEMLKQQAVLGQEIEETSKVDDKLIQIEYETPDNPEAYLLNTSITG